MLTEDVALQAHLFLFLGLEPASHSRGRLDSTRSLIFQNRRHITQTTYFWGRGGRPRDVRTNIRSFSAEALRRIGA